MKKYKCNIYMAEITKDRVGLGFEVLILAVKRGFLFKKTFFEWTRWFESIV